MLERRHSLVRASRQPFEEDMRSTVRKKLFIVRGKSLFSNLVVQYVLTISWIGPSSHDFAIVVE